MESHTDRRHDTRPDRPGSSLAGFAFVDMMMGMAMMAVVLVVVASTLTASNQERRFAEEKEIAQEALANEVARIKSLGFDGMLQEIAGLGPGQTLSFPVPGLRRDGAALPGEVLYVTNETLTDAQLGVPIGMPRDLDGDGVAATLDTMASGTATLVPVVVSVTWTGVAGTRSIRSVFVMLRAREGD